MSEVRYTCPHCHGRKRVPYQESQSQRQALLDRAHDEGDAMKVMFLQNTGLAITAMVCQPCDGRGYLVRVEP